MTTNYFYDENNIRYTLISTLGGKPLNWLFIPGGPGVDSSYLTDLTKLLQCQGNTWLIDLPGNGSHDIKKEGFDEWLSLFVPMVEKFDNPIIVGHSFGGMLPLLFNSLEEKLTGLIILNSAPSQWLNEARIFALEHNLPDLTDEMNEFISNPNQDTFDKAVSACVPYYFPLKTIDLGRQLLESVPKAYEPALWWQKKVIEMPYNAVWVPISVSTLIISGEQDGIVPYSLFENDQRFDRENIKKIFIKGAGHLPWIEEPELVRDIINDFQDAL